ncbi:hypothetical protein L1987_01652 [Smallanthus sonchifolius]|uniref:Uncharacterized protein n=1 Tax=Smallanthus sonchifolius TaxID=185202 RepID=A0ACB9K5T6_9ASTR|nr:hypothetical protein L1987_01652 [Smallanthus sonchifolius]
MRRLLVLKLWLKIFLMMLLTVEMMIKEMKTTDENKENEEVVSDEILVENILGPKHDEKEQKGDDDEEQEGDDEEEESIIFMRTRLMEHGGYKQEDTQEWGLDKLKEVMNRVEIEISMYENIKLEETKNDEKENNKKMKKKKKGSSPRSIELRRKWRHKLIYANVGYTWTSLNRTGDEILLKELDNLKKKSVSWSVLKEIQEETDTEKDENDVDTLLASVPFLQTGHPTKEDINQEKRIKTLSQALKSPYVNTKVVMGEKMTTTETLVTNYIFKDRDA